MGKSAASNRRHENSTTSKHVALHAQVSQQVSQHSTNRLQAHKYISKKTWSHRSTFNFAKDKRANGKKKGKKTLNEGINLRIRNYEVNF
jgi:hypothetical protein